MISFVGAGPGAADLLTVRAVDRLRAADVVVHAGSLVDPGALAHCRAQVVLHDSSAMTLSQVCAVFAEHPDASVVRLHSGDPTVFSAIGEQIAWCRANGREFEVVPGVSSVGAAAAAAGVELTVPGLAQSVVVTRLARGTRRSMPARETVEAFAAVGATMAVLLSVRHVEELVARLLSPGSGYTTATPAIAAHRVSRPDERLVVTTLGDLATATRDAGFEATTLFLVGPALAGAGATGSCAAHVYDPSYPTRFRPATTGTPA